MDFTLSDKQLRCQDAAREFAQDRLAPSYQARESQGYVEYDVRLDLGKRGFIAPEIPEGWGGRGLDRVTSGILTEEIARGDFSVAYLQVVGSLVGQILVRNALPEVATHWVSKICSGEQVVGIGLTEPHAGSDAGMPRLQAHREGDQYVLTGTKSLSFCADSSAVVVFARTGEQQRRGKGISAFLVPLDREGVRRESYPDMGTKAVGRGAVHFDGARVPTEYLIGDEGRGFSQVMQGFDFSRALIGLQCIGSVRSPWTRLGGTSANGKPSTSR